jgi:hypothetical protein
MLKINGKRKKPSPRYLPGDTKFETTNRTRKINGIDMFCISKVIGLVFWQVTIHQHDSR